MNAAILEKCGDIVKREIVLYGEKEEICCFLETYAQNLNIKAVITNYREEVKQQPYAEWGIECILFENVTLTKELIVVCDKNKFGIHQRYLKHQGKVEYQDYISGQLVDGLLYQKKLILCMGTQLLGQVYSALVCSTDLAKEYSIIFYPERELRESYMDRMQEYLHVARCCEIYIRSSCQEKQFYRKILNRTQLGKNCEIITVSDYGFGGYFPQIENDRDIISDYLLRERIRLAMSYETLAFSRTDTEIEKLCLEGTAVKDMKEILSDIGYFENTSIREEFENEVKRIKNLEKNDMIRLGEFIDQHKTECLCRNLNEWNEPVVSYVAETIISILGLEKVYFVNRKTCEKMIEETSGSELIIYPSVWNALELKDDIKTKKYKVVMYYNEMYMSMEEYLEYIADYYYKVMDIMSYTGMDQTLKE